MKTPEELGYAPPFKVVEQDGLAGHRIVDQNDRPAGRHLNEARAQNWCDQLNTKGFIED